MNEKKVLNDWWTLDDGTNHFTTIGYAVDVYDYLWKEITEYVANNPLEGVRNMQYHYDVLKELEQIAYDEKDYDNDRERKLYRLDIEDCYPTLSVLEASDVNEKKVLNVYVCDRGGRFTVNCPEMELMESVEAENVFYCLNDFTIARNDRDVVIRCID